MNKFLFCVNRHLHVILIYNFEELQLRKRFRFRWGIKVVEYGYRFSKMNVAIMYSFMNLDLRF